MNYRAEQAIKKRKSHRKVVLATICTILSTTIIGIITVGGYIRYPLAVIYLKLFIVGVVLITFIVAFVITVYVLWEIIFDTEGF